MLALAPHLAGEVWRLSYRQSLELLESDRVRRERNAAYHKERQADDYQMHNSIGFGVWRAVNMALGGKKWEPLEMPGEKEGNLPDEKEFMARWNRLMRLSGKEAEA